jgi:hypothetical protein
MSPARPLQYQASKLNRRAFRDDYDVVFARANLSTRNILVHVGHVSSILDWNTAGYYPEYWEYVKTIDHAFYLSWTFWASGWPGLVAELFPRLYENEFTLYTFTMRLY